MLYILLCWKVLLELHRCALQTGGPYSASLVSIDRWLRVQIWAVHYEEKTEWHISICVADLHHKQFTNRCVYHLSGVCYGRASTCYCQAPPRSKPPICPALYSCEYPLVNMAQISVHSLRHYIWEIKTEEQTLWFHKNIMCHKWNEYNE